MAVTMSYGRQIKIMESELTNQKDADFLIGLILEARPQLPPNPEADKPRPLHDRLKLPQWLLDIAIRQLQTAPDNPIAELDKRLTALEQAARKPKKNKTFRTLKAAQADDDQYDEFVDAPRPANPNKNSEAAPKTNPESGV